MSISSTDLIPSSSIGLTRVPQRESRQQNDFDHYLNHHYSPQTSSRAHQGSHDVPGQFADSYYWQHQALLQQSALRFTTAQTQQKPSTDSSNEKKVIEIDNLVLENKVEAKTTITPCFNKAYTSDITHLKSEALFHEFVKFFQEKSTCIWPLTTKSQIRPLYDNKIPSPRSTTQSLLEKPVFQPYQLFISNKQVELTLNTHALTLDEANQLKKLIKQWINNKGFFLNKVIINGVEQ